MDGWKTEKCQQPNRLMWLIWLMWQTQKSLECVLWQRFHPYRALYAVRSGCGTVRRAPSCRKTKATRWDITLSLGCRVSWPDMSWPKRLPKTCGHGFLQSDFLIMIFINRLLWERIKKKKKKNVGCAGCFSHRSSVYRLVFSPSSIKIFLKTEKKRTWRQRVDLGHPGHREIRKRDVAFGGMNDESASCS